MKCIGSTVVLKKLFLSLTVVFILMDMILAFNYPGVSTFDPNTIDAGNQNWMIDQKANGDVVFANERGLLIFNGSQWQLYPFSALNAVRVVKDKIYTGGYMTFGYWEELPTGEYHYTSLIEGNNDILITDEQFWSIIAWESGVIFQSLDRLIYYDELSGELVMIPVENGVSKLFVARDRIFFQDIKRDLYILEGKTPVLYFSSDQLPESVIINLFSTDYGIILFTAGEGFYKLQTNGFMPWAIEDPTILQEGDFFSALQLNNGYFALGSITRGLFLLDQQGNLKQHLDQRNSLSNNTILHIFEDKSRNLWLGLDNGINVVHLSSPLREYLDKDGQLGTVYAATIHDGYLYIGTNQGLFYKPYKSQEDFSLVKNTNGQVWSICHIGDDLFCGHNLGTYIIKNNLAKRVSDELGTWNIMPYPGNKDLLIQGNYNGIHLLQKVNNEWMYFKKLEPFVHSSRQFNVVDDYLYYYHATLGLKRVKLSPDGSVIDEPQLLYKSELLEQPGMVAHNDRIVFSTREGLYVISSGMDSLRTVVFGGNTGTSPGDELGRLVTLSDSELAFIQGNDLYILHYLNNTYQIKNVFFLDGKYFKSKVNFENISKLDSATYLLGMTNGYLLLDLNKIDLLDEEYSVQINSIYVNQSNNSAEPLAKNQEEGFPFQMNNFTFHYNIHNQVKYQSVVFQYKLEGDQTKWSDWADQASASFYKLKPGPYSFKVRARIGDKISQNVAVFNFWIKNPWYLSLYAYLVYFILFILSLFMVNTLYNRMYKRRQDNLIEKAEKELEYIKLKGEQELMREKNERLRTEIEAKNKELAVTAMSMVKKNEFLIEIRDHLKDIESTAKFRPDLTIRSINREIENEESWEMLKNAFENVDKDFIKKLLTNHPELTPNDLKLCTYLRLNLNSKEIATLLNISVRSMETKRYRLRKKLNLSHQTNLVEYILAV